jgi:hypothetical protein
MSTSSQKRAEEYREKVERFKRLKLISIITVITDLVMAVIWIFLFVKRTSGMEFSPLNCIFHTPKLAPRCTKSISQVSEVNLGARNV